MALCYIRLRPARGDLMERLLVGLAVFFGVHSISLLALDWRNRIAERLGRTAWQGLYSVAALVSGSTCSSRATGRRGRPQPYCMYRRRGCDTLRRS